ncbi:3-polyprenyl-4-hydroxybenzoate carboxy-lyase [Mucinivorans hirudinis]|uniref:3-polyprenyl-4-hydroxybenzoate carboxy-lyase n=1 Tax=Mucinivorans hirudinis TaxID=1433126 RepID=A0A060R9M6_9BACT|nr:3-polyprenyl-4-hydroxybenzoate carboxy-lyase [Mucinivorans hirudinis]
MRLREFIKELENQGEVLRVSEYVDPILEITELTDRQCKSIGGGKALLFENSALPFPVLTNMMGSQRRMAMVLGVDKIGDIELKINNFIREVTAPKKSLKEKIGVLPLLASFGKWLPRSVSGRGECQQVRLSSLNDIPILKTWQYDAERFITLPMVHTVDPQSGARNVGMYRMQVMDEMTTGMHWHKHKTGERHYQQYKALKQRMPVTVCVGGDPVYTYAATAPLPDGIDEYILAGFLRNKPVKMVKCLTNNLEVPADCDFVIEGYVDPSEEKVTEGAFGDHTGFYSLPDYYPLFHVTCITCRRDAIYPATVVGIPPMEDAWIAAATERIFVSPIRFAMIPELIDMQMPTEGVAHNIAICKIRKSYAGQGFKVANTMWGAGQMMFNKFIVILSENQNIKDRLEFFDPLRDIMQQRGTLDVLDHTSPAIGFGGKMCFDLTAKTVEEGARQKIDFIINGCIPDNCRVLEEWHTLFFFGWQSDGFYEGAKCIILFDDRAKGLSNSDLLWLAVANADAVRDVRVEQGRVVVDARFKRDIGRDFPNIVSADIQTIKSIDHKWESLGLGEFIPSPSLKYHSLIFSDSAEVKY